MTVTDQASEPDLLGVGQHCAHPECQQLDFLPFKCSRCSAVFCLDHRTAASHACAPSQADTEVVVCPVCAQGVRLQEGEDPNLAFDRHSRTDCNPENYSKVHKKPRCPAPSCREKLNSLNSFTCKECGTTVCLKHRLASDHACEGRRAAGGGLGSSFRKLFGAAAPSDRGPRVQAAPAVAAKPTAKAAVSAAARQAGDALRSQIDEFRANHRRRARAPGSGASDAAGAASGAPQRASPGHEQCPQCPARFGSVQQLIDHASTAHQDGWSTGSSLATRPAGGGTVERCPHCGRVFADPVELVSHVERQHHGGRPAENCVVC